MIAGELIPIALGEAVSEFGGVRATATQVVFMQARVDCSLCGRVGTLHAPWQACVIGRWGGELSAALQGGRDKACMLLHFRRFILLGSKA